MKAALIQRGIAFPRTHSLIPLAELLEPTLAEKPWSSYELRLLSQAAVSYRYPGESAGPEDAAEAFEVCSRLRTKMLALFSPD